MHACKSILIALLAYALAAAPATAQESGDLSERLQQKLTMLATLHADKLISDKLYEQRRLALARRISLVEGVDKSRITNLSLDYHSSGQSSQTRLSNDVKGFALIIGADNYQHFPSLQSAVNDARAIAKIFRSSFDFDVQLLENPDRHRLLTALSQYRHNLDSGDQFVLYYAGHGHLDKLTQRGYWLPIDAEKDNPTNWVSTSDISDALLALPARQALVIADSCYAGSLASGEPIVSVNSGQLNQHRSRTVITSGGLEPVLDSGANGHSIFANAFMKQLAQIHKGDSVQSIFTRLRKQVKNLSQQTPEYSIIPDAGHESGEFVFYHD